MNDVSETKNPAPPSGPWIGYYLYSPGGRPHDQRMDLSFAGGVVSGNGQDDIGLFDVAGRYSINSGLVSWLKAYRGAHRVSYRGYFEKRSIFGGWKIDAQCHGGFKIWPAPPGTVGNANSDAVAESLQTVLTRYAKANGLSMQESFNILCGGAYPLFALQPLPQHLHTNWTSRLCWGIRMGPPLLPARNQNIEYAHRPAICQFDSVALHRLPPSPVASQNAL